MTYTCPNCGAPMAVDTFQDIQLQVCTKCEGIWFDADELRTLLQMDPEALADLSKTLPPVTQSAAGPSEMRCPVDQNGLEHYNYMEDSPIVLQTCPRCGGFFVAADQLAKMQQYLDQTRSPMSETEALKVAYAGDVAQHEAFMARQAHLTSFFGALRRYGAGWFGFFP